MRTTCNHFKVIVGIKRLKVTTTRIDGIPDSVLDLVSSPPQVFPCSTNTAVPYSTEPWTHRWNASLVTGPGNCLNRSKASSVSCTLCNGKANQHRSLLHIPPYEDTCKTGLSLLNLT